MDPEDYAEEWEFLTRSGLTAGEIIDRSDPDERWFNRYIKERVQRRAL